ncbi:hypothetical protein FZEAL_499 [Fusarium zealandicum]|uniref:non-specific serine/threonine protein kinase n=1 Tax=Fusarium zealandicum TaxID=1053134 RepID=A0A8H4XQ92_9HYPO|nr:hypothetical protein FZEAL_499 [Fusarium zealandicum]
MTSPRTPPRQTSPPDSPGSEPPDSEGGDRFSSGPECCECPENYRPGGLFAVQIGDTLGRKRYQVIAKLGHGISSTVWLAVTSVRRQPKYVAIKIMAAEFYLLPTELGISLRGRNGRHTCFVYEPMGPTVEDIMADPTRYWPEAQLDNNNSNNSNTARCPTWMVKRILKHTLYGLLALHQRGVIHGNLQCDKLVLRGRGLDLIPEAELTQIIGDDTYPLARLDGKVDNWAPPYLVKPLQLTEHMNISFPRETMDIRICGLGTALLSTETSEMTSMAFSTRLPELVLEQPLDERSDVWSFGCLMYRLLTGSQLLPEEPVREVDPLVETKEQVAFDEYLLATHCIIGPLPPCVMQDWAEQKGKLWLGPDGERLYPPECLPPDHESYRSEPFQPLEVMFERYKADDIDAEESNTITCLLRDTLRFLPEQRMTIDQLLMEPWFDG